MRDLESVTRVALRGRRVLLVDDDEINRLVAGELLGDVAGMHVTQAASGAEALDRLAGAAFDLVLMDVRMPGMDGCETTRLLRAQPGLRELPVIAVTAHLNPGDHGRCLTAGMSDVVHKPFDPVLLFAVMRRWLLHGRGAQGGASAEEAGGTPAFSSELGLRRCLGRRELYAKIALRYLETRADLAGELQRAWDAGERLEAERLAHSLISTAGTLGATALSELARALQAASQAGDAAWWAALLDEARDEHARVCAELRELLATPS
jgi:CheY-like chemotaxis protein